MKISKNGTGWGDGIMKDEGMMGVGVRGGTKSVGGGSFNVGVWDINEEGNLD